MINCRAKLKSATRRSYKNAYVSLSYHTHYFSEDSGYDFALFFGNEKPAKPYAMRVFYGASKQIRTADLILTKDVRYLSFYAPKPAWLRGFSFFNQPKIFV